mgnify:FL=1|tara:strand:+ start:909 stop:1247 length:339 start_codon:yes stop_codon:yes gene_type:complete
MANNKKKLIRAGQENSAVVQQENNINVQHLNKSWRELNERVGNIQYMLDELNKKVSDMNTKHLNMIEENSISIEALNTQVQTLERVKTTPARRLLPRPYGGKKAKKLFYKKR